VFFATLDNARGVLSTERWAFPTTAYFVRRPYISETPSIPGRYYICGDYDQQAYVIFVDINSVSPATIWANIYSANTLYARSLIESPYDSD